MATYIQHQITNDPALVLAQIQDNVIQNFFRCSIKQDYKCTPVLVIQNNNKMFYQSLEYYISLIIKESAPLEIQQRSQNIQSTIKFPYVETFFGNVRDQFIDDDYFQLCLKFFSDQIKINFQFTINYKSTIVGNNLGEPIQLIIFQNARIQPTIYVMFAKRPKFTSNFKLQTPLQPNKIPLPQPGNGQQFIQGNNLQQFKQLPIIEPRQQKFPSPFQGQGTIGPPFQQPQQPQVVFPNPIGKFGSTFPIKKEIPNIKYNEFPDVLATEQINNQISQQNANQDKEGSEIYSKSIRVQNYPKSQDCPVCYKNYQINNEESVLTLCCKQNLHKSCYQQYINEMGTNCSKFSQLKCYQCGKEIDSDFLKQNLNKGIYCQIASRQSMQLTNLKCFQCQTPLILTKQQVKEICPNVSCRKEICAKCFKEFHGDTTTCPNLQQQILEALRGQPIIYCPFCNQIQTKDDGCDHVKCAGCQFELCSECSCDRRQILTHGNHFHRIGCKHWKGEQTQLSKDSEYKRDCSYCQINGNCKKPEPLVQYKKLKNYF